MKAQRLRLKFRLAPPASNLNHREIAGAIVGAFEAAGYSVSYSEGKRPVPQVALAAPLPQDVTSECELADVFLSEAVRSCEAAERVGEHLPEGMTALLVTEVGVGAPSLQSQLRWAEYDVVIPANGLQPGDVRDAVGRLLSASSLPVEHARENRVRRYDLRPLVLGMEVEDVPGNGVAIRMRLRAEQDMTGRADQTLAALGLPPAASIRRTRLEVEEVPPALAAYRRAGEPEA
jgi:radical SAM-linked protein